MTPTGQYSLDKLLDAANSETEIKAKLSIINALRNNQAYTEDDIGGIIGHVNEIYKKVENSGDQFNTIVTQIAKDMNETSVSEVLNNLEKYKIVSKTPPGPPGTPKTVNQPPTETVPDPTGKAVNQPVPADLLAKLQAKLKNPSWRQDNSDRDENGRIIYTFEDNGKVYRIANDENSNPIILSVTPVSEQ